jgi:hypothetical protein
MLHWLSIPSFVERIVDPHLRVGVRNSDVYPVVEVNLSRIQDQTRQKRVQLAKQVASTIHQSLATNNFHGPEPNSKFILLARIVAVSDGNAMAQLWVNKLGIGNAKLTVSYFLFSRQTGKVALEKQIFLTNGCPSWNVDAGGDNGTQLVMGMADKCAREIPREVMASIQQHPTPRRTYD